MSQEIFKDLEKPEDRLTITVNGKEKEILMSGALVRRLTTLCLGYGEDPSVVYLNPEVQEICMIESLVERDKNGRVVEGDKDKTIFAFDVSVEDSEALVNWMGDHVLYFFIKGSTTVGQAAKKIEKTMGNLMSYLSGPQASPNET